MNLAELRMHLEQQEKRGLTWVSVSTKELRELLDNYKPSFFDHSDISGIIRQWPLPEGK